MIGFTVFLFAPTKGSLCKREKSFYFVRIGGNATGNFDVDTSVVNCLMRLGFPLSSVFKIGISPVGHRIFQCPKTRKVATRNLRVS